MTDAQRKKRLGRVMEISPKLLRKGNDVTGNVVIVTDIEPSATIPG